MPRRFYIAAVMALFATVSTGLCAPAAETLAQVLRLPELAEILQSEGQQQGETLDTDMLGGQGGAYFARQVRQIHATDGMVRTIRQALKHGMSDAQMQASIAFFRTDLGQRILSLENAGRRAMADPVVEQIARDSYEALQGSEDARLAAVSRFVEINDLIERNVASALNSNYQFYRGLRKGAVRRADFDPLAEAWAQEPEVRAETAPWVHGFLLMAYRPLTASEMDSYLNFSRSLAGQALNAALFDGFDQMYGAISYRLGLAVAHAMAAQDI
ncbi:DUF2059 domain-containing protein [Rhodobacteraceae bacterium F11138]|nr:DUF2059 domain-containing protein [Rhodobacteraceae bacterium F11138]